MRLGRRLPDSPNTRGNRKKLRNRLIPSIAAEHREAAGVLSDAVLDSGTVTLVHKTLRRMHERGSLKRRDVSRVTIDVAEAISALLAGDERLSSIRARIKDKTKAEREREEQKIWSEVNSDIGELGEILTTSQIAGGAGLEVPIVNGELKNITKGSWEKTILPRR